MSNILKSVLLSLLNATQLRYKIHLSYCELVNPLFVGLELVHDLTSQADYELWINLKDFDGNEKYARYDYFSLGDAASNYVLNVGDYEGDAGRIHI